MNLSEKLFHEQLGPFAMNRPVLGRVADVATVNHQRERLGVLDADVVVVSAWCALVLVLSEICEKNENLSGMYVYTIQYKHEYFYSCISLQSLIYDSRSLS